MEHFLEEIEESHGLIIQSLIAVVLALLAELLQRLPGSAGHNSLEHLAAEV